VGLSTDVREVSALVCDLSGRSGWSF